MELNPAQLGTLDIANGWVPYVDLYDADFLPSRLKLGNDEYAYNASILILGHSATLPDKVRELRAVGKQPIVVERGDRYYIFVTPP